MKERNYKGLYYVLSSMTHWEGQWDLHRWPFRFLVTEERVRDELEENASLTTRELQVTSSQICDGISENLMRKKFIFKQLGPESAKPY